jgi:hypothetical protein
MPLEGIIQLGEQTSAPNVSGLNAAAQQAGRGRIPGPLRRKKGEGRRQKEREDGREVESERARGAAGFYMTKLTGWDKSEITRVLPVR